MIAESSGGGGSEGDSGGRETLLRRRHAPAIRMRPVTPARSGRSSSDRSGSAGVARRPLPAPRPPAVRAIRRPVLQLVADSGAFDALDAGSRREPVSTAGTGGVVRFWERRSLAFAFAIGLALIAAPFVVVALATLAIRTGQRSDEASANVVSTTTVMSGVLPAATSETTVAVAPAPAAEIPLIDVKSLPAAPPAKRRR